MEFVTDRDFVALDVANAVLGIAVLAFWVLLGVMVARGLYFAHRHQARHSKRAS